MELSDNITIGHLDGIEGLVTQRGGRRKYRNTLATNMSKETVSFLDKVMKLDPRDRPAPQELLQDQWFSGVVDCLYGSDLRFSGKMHKTSAIRL